MHTHSRPQNYVRSIHVRLWALIKYTAARITCLYLYTPHHLKRAWSWGSSIYHGKQTLLETSSRMSWKKLTFPSHGKRFARLTSITREVTCPNLILEFELLWLPKYYPHGVFTYVTFRCGEFCASSWYSDLMPSNDAVLPRWRFCVIWRERFGFWDQDRSSLTQPLPLLWKESWGCCLSRQLTLPILSLIVIDSIDMTSAIGCFEGTCPVFKAVASFMWTTSYMSDLPLRLPFHGGFSQVDSVHMLTKARISGCT